VRFASEPRPKETLAHDRAYGELSVMPLSPIPAARVFRLYPAWTVLRGFRCYEGLTQQELADSVGASRTTISSIERRRSIPSVALALALARRLDTSVEDLFDLDDLR
jgi:putative transcriptional regulator